MKFRKLEIKVYTKIGIDKETYQLLRTQKRIQKKSMMRINKDLIFKEFGGQKIDT